MGLTLTILTLLTGLAYVALRLWRRRQPRPVVGLALGVFDFCHEGHINLIRRADMTAS